MVHYTFPFDFVCQWRPKNCFCTLKYGKSKEVFSHLRSGAEQLQLKGNNYCTVKESLHNNRIVNSNSYDIFSTFASSEI